jgi:5-methylcytosine-specific restriction endonuclease McrA
MRHGRQQYCSPCKAKVREEVLARYREANREQIRERGRRWNAEHQEHIREYNRTYTRKRTDTRETRAVNKDRIRFDGLRTPVLDRDSHRCVLCHATEDDGERFLTIHHIDGDKTHNAMGNLITLCRRCHPTVHNHWFGPIQQQRLRDLIARK